MNNIKIYSVHFNRPDFVKLQLDSFNRFVKNEFEFVIINNANDPEISKQCELLNIECVSCDNSHLDPSSSHSAGLAMLQEYITNDGDIHIILDHDMFIIDDVDLVEYSKDYSLIFLNQQSSGVDYIWPGLVVINSNNSPDLHTLGFSYGIFNDIRFDSGGESCSYLLNNNLNNRLLLHVPFFVNDTDELNAAMYHYDKTFLHYFRGSNWINMSDDIIKLKDKKINDIIYGTDTI